MVFVVCRRSLRSSHKLLVSAQRRLTASSSTSTTSRASLNSSKSKPFFQNAYEVPLAWYTKVIDAYPLLTKCLTAGVVSCAGDLASQKLLKGEDGKIDLMQTARFVFMNVFMVGPTLHYWYLWLSRHFPGTSLASVAKRVVWDEFIFTPLYYPVFLTALWKLEQGPSLTMEKVQHMLWHEMPGLLVAEWAMFIPSQAINFRFVPLKFQVLFSNLVGVVWNGYLSATAQNAQTKHLEESTEATAESPQQNTEQKDRTGNKMDEFVDSSTSLEAV